MKNETEEQRQKRLEWHREYNKKHYANGYKEIKKERFEANPDLVERDREQHKLARRKQRLDPEFKAKEKAYRAANKDKISQYSKEYNAANKDKLRLKSRTDYCKKKELKESDVDAFLHHITRMLNKPARKGRKVTVDTAYITKMYYDQKGLCNLTKIKMLNKFSDPRAISIDRIDSSKDYLEGNVQLVCRFANLGKQHFDQETILGLIQEIRETNEVHSN